MGKGQSFLADDKTARGIIKHLRVVISDVDAANECLVVCVTTWYEGVRGQDSSCILEAGCHNFIKHKSWIDFSRSKAMEYIEIFNGLQKGLLIKKDDLEPSLVVKIQKAAKKSEFLPVELERFFAYF